MKPDIKNRADIEACVNGFYDLVKVDPEIGFFFSEVVPVNWAAHLPRMYDFWENILFHTGGFEGNPMQKHREVHNLHSLEARHFELWIQLFDQTIDSRFEGPNAQNLKQKAAGIAAIMQSKMG
jgi:hemoglobin